MGIAGVIGGSIGGTAFASFLYATFVHKPFEPNELGTGPILLSGFLIGAAAGLVLGIVFARWMNRQ